MKKNSTDGEGIEQIKWSQQSLCARWIASARKRAETVFGREKRSCLLRITHCTKCSSNQVFTLLVCFKRAVLMAIHFFVTLGIFEWLYLAYSWIYLHRTWGFCKASSALLIWLCGSIVANPILYRLVPSPSRFENRQWAYTCPDW